MSHRLKFVFFLVTAVSAGLLISSVWTLRTRLAFIFSLAAGVILGKLYSDLRKELKGSGRPVPALSTEQMSEATGLEPHAGALLDVVMSGMREGMLVVDGDMRVVASNRAAREMLGPTKVTWQGQRLSDLTRNPAIHSAFTTTLDSREQAGSKVEMKGPGGPIYDLTVAPLRLDTEQNSRGALGIFVDITRIERLERVRQEFLSNVSHELRTPLTAILAFIETLQEGAAEDPDTSRRFLAIIRKNAERMHTLIDDILELSAIEAGTVSLKPEPVHLHLLVGDIISALASQASERGVTVRNEVAADVIILADPHRIEQMITNLVDNSIKFNRRGGTVTVTHEKTERDRIEVRDTGEGIPQESVKRIFERFYRVDRARSSEIGGTGLGLAIVKHLALAHGGEVSVHSTLGQGSTFTIELPILLLENPIDNQDLLQLAEQQSDVG